MCRRKTIYLRVTPEIHLRVVEYASAYGFTVNDVVVCLLEQLLVQVDPSFPVPDHLEGVFGQLRQVREDATVRQPDLAS